ncbi:unnamed protein product [Microthlaspi erraticum]|uniref:Uncharacterized protein n=1 Tax=Microthlaspi erraticum TaxID=1685480 RepID=A0A6D2KPW2_9BRAS|nr:unnamed protein product [Microthlaspi erraticum]
MVTVASSKSRSIPMIKRRPLSHALMVLNGALEPFGRRSVGDVKTKSNQDANQDQEPVCHLSLTKKRVDHPTPTNFNELNELNASVNGRNRVEAESSSGFQTGSELQLSDDDSGTETMADNHGGAPPPGAFPPQAGNPAQAQRPARKIGADAG